MTNTQQVAQASATQGQSGSLVGALAPIVLVILVFYFLIIRPQQKREAKTRELINSIKKGDKVVTSSGIIGVIHKVVGDKELSLEISENVRIRVLKNAVTQILANDVELEKGEILEHETSKPRQKLENKQKPKKSTSKR
jgi:preprotein translocase subunit YajC